MKTVIIDNYDSFSYNLAHMLRHLGADVDVLRNDAFNVDSLNIYDHIVLSPGPGILTKQG
jgi:anthranilate synthase component 2